jgi:hypothetical protein
MPADGSLLMKESTTNIAVCRDTQRPSFHSPRRSFFSGPRTALPILPEPFSRFHPLYLTVNPRCSFAASASASASASDSLFLLFLLLVFLCERAGEPALNLPRAASITLSPLILIDFRRCTVHNLAWLAHYYPYPSLIPIDERSSIERSSRLGPFSFRQSLSASWGHPSSATSTLVSTLVTPKDIINREKAAFHTSDSSGPATERAIPLALG